MRATPETLVVARRPPRAAAVLAAVLSAACWGSATVMSKSVLNHMPPMTLVTVQLAASVCVLWVAVLLLRLRVRLDRPTRKASLSGLLEPGLAYTFGIIGLALTTASNSALIGAAEPIFILLLAWLILKERIGAPMLMLAATATVGLLLVVAPDASGLPGRGSLFGDLLVLAGTLFAAFYVIATRRLVLSIDPLPLSALQQSAGLTWTLGVLVIALGLGLTRLGLEGVTFGVLALAAASGIIQYALAFWFYLFALQRLPANVAAFYLTLIPVFGVGAAFVFLGEALTLLQWLGAVCVIVSVGAISRVGGD
ncbi:DMT family transporter [Spiribacter halobius]|nr:DMT family transporter [Spiribacter halobius]UEX77641.1 DMT family transporter [Spiribacter halobius]